MAIKKIRVLVVDDSLLARRIITQGLSAHQQIEVIGEAVNAMDAYAKLKSLKPDVITLDVEMPGMSGIDFVKRVLPEYPIPIILVSSLDLRVFQALSIGAVDFVHKPDSASANAHFIEELTAKIIIASNARVRRAGTSLATAAGMNAASGTRPTEGGVAVNNGVLSLGPVRGGEVIIGLGASTGGTEATFEVLRRLPANTPGIVIVQHMPVGFTKMYAERLDRNCAMKVTEAKNGDIIRQGHVLVAPGDKQMRVVKTGNHYTVSCQAGPKVSGHCPSVDALFSSMAQSVRCRMVGIILTGMGRDGADGLLAMRKNGAFTIGQDKESSVVYGMPMVAYNVGAVQKQASCENIAAVLVQHLSSLH